MLRMQHFGGVKSLKKLNGFDYSADGGGFFRS